MRARLAVSQAVADSIARSAETRGRLAQAQAHTRAAEDAHGAEAESFGMARAHREQVEQKAQEAQRILNEARNALRKAGLEDVETRITQLQRRLKRPRSAPARPAWPRASRCISSRPRGRRMDSRRRWRSRRRRTSPSATKPLARCSPPSPIASICRPTR